MLRSSRLAVLASVVLIAATAPAAMASPGTVRTAQPVAKGDTLTVTVAEMPTITLHRFETMPDSFDAIRYDASVRAPEVGQAIWGERAQKANQNFVFNRAFADVMRRGTFKPDSFAMHFLTSLVDYAGAENVRESARSFRLAPDRYRIVLRALAALDSRGRSKNAGRPQGFGLNPTRNIGRADA
jgi:hypothetical protein